MNLWNEQILFNGTLKLLPNYIQLPWFLVPRQVATVRLEMCSFIVNLPRKRQPAWHMPTSSTRWRLKVQFWLSFASKMYKCNQSIEMNFCCNKMYMDVSENSGTPKSSILIGFSIINHPFWGTPIFGNTHIENKNLSWIVNWWIFQFVRSFSLHIVLVSYFSHL